MESVPAQPELRVLHVFRYFRPDFTGEGLYLEKLARHLAGCGVVSDVLVSNSAAASTDDGSIPPGLSRIVYVGNGGSGQRVRPRLLAWLLLNLRRYHAVHIHSCIDRFFVVPALARLFGCRVVQSCTLDDGFGSLVASYRGWRRPVARLLARLVNDVVAISPKLHDDSLRAMPAPRVHLVPQAVEKACFKAETRAAVRARLGLAEDETLLLFVGGICRRKGVLELVEATVTLGERLHLLIVGPDLEPEYAARVRQSAAGMVRFAGYADDPTPYYHAADVFVFASFAEGFGNVLIEAMGFGLPVVCRRLPGVTDAFIDHGRTGFLFESLAEYQGTVLRLAGDTALRARIGARARRYVRAAHGFPEAAHHYSRIYGGRS